LRVSSHTLVACVGDSITRGQVSASYVDRLARRWAADGFHFRNLGVNGDLAYNVLQRLDAAIRVRPDVVTLLVGTNDVNAQFDAAWRDRYRRDQHLPVDPTRSWYGEQIDRILSRLRAETDARIAVLDIPPLGEDPDSRMNELVRAYNATLAEVAAAHGVPVLPLHARLLALLPPGHRPPPYTGDVRLVMKASFKHMVLRRSWDSIAADHGLVVLTDHLHLADRAADIVADLIGTILPPSAAVWAGATHRPR
jgi:lysophospholipase L1-like esterase